MVRVRVRGAADTLRDGAPVGRLNAQHYIERLERAGTQRDRPVAAVLSLKIDGRSPLGSEKRGLFIVADYATMIDEVAFLQYGSPRENDNRLIGTKKAYIDWGAGPLTVVDS